MPTMTPEIAAAINAANQRYGTFAQAHPNFLQATAKIESSFDPSARNPSGAAGLYQFMPGTARAFGLSNPYDPSASADAATRLAIANGKTLSGVLGREPTDGELYLAHQQGAGGASNLLSDPTSKAVDTVGYKAVTQNGGSPDMTNQQFANLWINKVDGSQTTPTAQAGAFGLNGPTAVGGTGAPFSMTGPVDGSAPIAPSADDPGLDPMKLMQAITGSQGGQQNAAGGGSAGGSGAGKGFQVQAPRPRPFALMRFPGLGAR